MRVSSIGCALTLIRQKRRCGTGLLDLEPLSLGAWYGQDSPKERDPRPSQRDEEERPDRRKDGGGDQS